MERTYKDEFFEFQYRESMVDTRPIWESHCHIRFEMITVIEGDISIIIEGRRFRCTSEKIAILPPLVYHSIRANQKSNYRRITALFDRSAIPDQIESEICERLAADPIINHPDLPRYIANLEKIFSSSYPEHYAPLARAIMTEVLYSASEQGESEPSQIDATLEKILRYIDTHVRDKILIDDIAKELFLSSSTVCHIFQDKMKISIKQYVLQKKIALATTLMRDGMSASEAARYVGYENYSNFYNAYKKLFGTTPSGTQRSPSTKPQNNV